MNRKGYNEDYLKPKKQVTILVTPEKEYLISYQGEDSKVTRHYFEGVRPTKGLCFEKDGTSLKVTTIQETPHGDKYIVEIT
jgi:hypothetical protein